MAPRTAMQVMAEQQDLIKKQDQSIGNLLMIAKDQQGQITRLTAGLQYLSQLAGVEHKVASSMGLKLVEADVQNPAQPIPEPPAVPATQSTEEAKTPEAFADVQAPGLVPGTTNDVAADVTTTNYTPGQDVPAPAVKNLVDVTAPVEGTQTQRPLNETKTETDVRVGNPMNPQTAFPLGGPFAQQMRTSAKTPQEIMEESRTRTMASIRLARLRMTAGIEQVPQGSVQPDMEIAGRIEKDASLSLDSIEQEIRTLDAVVKSRAATPQHNPSLVPKSATRRQTPPMAGGGTSAQADDSDEMLFLN